MRMLLVLDLEDSDLFGPEGAFGPGDAADYVTDDVRLSLRARLSEAGYFGRHDTPVRGTLIAAEEVEGETLDLILSAADVGLEGLDDTVGDHPDHVVNPETFRPALDKAWQTVKAMREGVASW